MEIQGDQRSGRTQLVYGGLKKVPWAAGKGLRTQWYETPGGGGKEQAFVQPWEDICSLFQRLYIY